MDTRRNRFAFLVGIAIGLMVNLGLLPWLQRGPDGLSLTTSPLSRATAAPGYGESMASVFELLGLSYVEDQSIFMGEGIDYNYFDATTPGELEANAGEIGPTYDVRFTLAYLDEFDATSQVSSAAQNALLSSGIQNQSGLDPVNTQSIVAAVAGTLECGSRSAIVSGIATTIVSLDGTARQLLLVTSIHPNEAEAVATAHAIHLVAGTHLGQPLPLGPVGPTGEPRSTDCETAGDAVDRCACEYNACVILAHANAKDATAVNDALFFGCVATAMVGFLATTALCLGSCAFVAFLAFLAIVAICLAMMVYANDKVIDAYERNLAACTATLQSCLYDAGVFHD